MSAITQNDILDRLDTIIELLKPSNVKPVKQNISEDSLNEEYAPYRSLMDECYKFLIHKYDSEIFQLFKIVSICHCYIIHGNLKHNLINHIPYDWLEIIYKEIFKVASMEELYKLDNKVNKKIIKQKIQDTFCILNNKLYIGEHLSYECIDR